MTEQKLQAELKLPEGQCVDGYWDRHSSVNTKALNKWFMAGDDQDKLIKDKFQNLLRDVDKLVTNQTDDEYGSDG